MNPSFDIILNQTFLEDFFLIKDEPEKNEDLQDSKNDFWRFLRKSRRNATYYGDFESLEAFGLAAEENPLLELLINEGPLNMAYAAHSGTLDADDPLLHSGRASKVFLFDELPETTVAAIQQGGYIWISNQELSESWLPYSQTRSDSTFIISQQGDGDSFTNWEQLAIFAHPLHSIIIWDPYILTEKLEKNLKPLLKVLTSKCERHQSIQLLIVTEKIERDGDKEVKPEKIEEEIETYLKKKASIKVEVELIPYSYSDMKEANSQERHIDRWLLTNNFLLEAGHGFNIFNEKNKIERSSKLELKFALSDKHRLQVCHLLQIAEKYVRHKTKQAPRNRLLSGIG
jgi:hypothetical protein